MPEPYLSRTCSVHSSVRDTSDRRMYGASASQVRFGHGSDISLLQINFLFSLGIFPNFMLLCYQLNFNTKNTLWERVRKRLCIAVRKKNKLRKCYFPKNEYPISITNTSINADTPIINNTFLACSSSLRLCITFFLLFPIMCS